MNTIDTFVLFGTLTTIVLYGIWKTRVNTNIESYFLGNQSLKWSTIGLSVMATQASAITFISTPGQGYASGMAFVQNYLGLPIAMIIVATVFIPLYYRLKVYTAYEFLEQRFDLKTRILGATLFLIQRGLAAGITIYAPAIILSPILKWDLSFTILMVGGLVILYTVSGGSRAVSITQKQQMTIIMIGMFTAFGFMIYYLGDFLTFQQTLKVAGNLGKLNAINFDFDLETRYTIWSGLAAGVFLQLSYFGTDQSQVARYLGGVSTTESKLGLMFNALFKIPMQFFILLMGVILFVFYTIYSPPLHFNQSVVEKAKTYDYDQYRSIENSFLEQVKQQRSSVIDLANALDDENKNAAEDARKQYQLWSQEISKSKSEIVNIVRKNEPDAGTEESDYVFLNFIFNFLPTGLVGLLIAVIFSAAMSSTSSEINALASTTIVDYYKRLVKTTQSDLHYVRMSRLLTLIWGIIAIVFALFANSSENLIEAVNIVGSLFYGTILGIFLVAFFLKWVNGNAVFWAAVLSQLTVIFFHILSTNGIIGLSYLWYNVIGCMQTILLAFIFQLLGQGIAKSID